MSCKHNWKLMKSGEYATGPGYEVYYCGNCLAQVTVEFPEGKRSVMDYAECEQERQGETG